MTEIVASQTPPILHRPSEKERKYDRQLRLWAASGQAALEAANILVLNSGGGTVMTETLKNLILPGIGRFTIYDDAKVQETDLGVNFFLDESTLGRSRAQACTELLLELNPEVEGDYHPKEGDGALGLAELLDTSPTYTLILYAHPITAADLALVTTYATTHKAPLVTVHSVGFYSFFRVRLPSAFPIVDTHPDETATTDLRLLAPWPELEAFAREQTWGTADHDSDRDTSAGSYGDLDALDDHAHGHVPYIVLLLYYLDKWRATHDGANPTTYGDKTSFRRMVAAGARRNTPEGGEENFDEAAAAVLRNVERPGLPAALREVFAYEPQEADRTSTFWTITRAVQQFCEKHGCLPLPGNVPDMKAQSQVYIQLQTLYKSKARKDAAEVLAAVQALPGGENVDPGEVDLFCKNAAHVKLVNATTLGEDRLATVVANELAKDEQAAEWMTPSSLVPIYLALKATAHDSATDAADLLTRMAALLPADSKIDLAGNKRVTQIATELARAGGGELHNISALTGGMVAQEVIKIITRQYVPIDNTCIFDGISSRCQILCL